MEIAMICVLIASFLPILCIGYAKLSSGFKLKDNKDPRGFLSSAEGASYRAKCAHDNSWEALTPFAISVAFAMISKVDPLILSRLCMIYIGFRLLYIWFYIYDKAALRSLVFTIAWFIVIGIFYLAIKAY